MTERLVSQTGTPKAKRGRGAGKSLVDKLAELGIEDLEGDIQYLKDNLGEAVGYTDIPANLAYAVGKEYGVDVGARRIKKGVAEEVWFEWPSYVDDDDNIVEDEDQVTANLNR